LKICTFLKKTAIFSKVFSIKILIFIITCVTIMLHVDSGTSTSSAKKYAEIKKINTIGGKKDEM